MTNKALQEERTRSYFIEATKEILKGEGSKALSVRNIAERAGYSYATLYNYFKDQTELVSLSVLEFKDECRDTVNKSFRKSDPGLEEIKGIVKAYISYFVQYPGVFDLFYIEKLASKSVNDEVINFLDTLCQEDWDYLMSIQHFTIEEVVGIRSILNKSVIGVLLSYLKRGTPSEYSAFVKEIDLLLENVLKK